MKSFFYSFESTATYSELNSLAVDSPIEQSDYLRTSLRSYGKQSVTKL